jgi:hypothetical protein
MRGNFFPVMLLSVSCLVALPAAKAMAQMTPYQQHAMQLAAYQRSMQMAVQQRAWQMAAYQNAQKVAAMQHAAQVLIIQQEQAAYMRQMTLQARQSNPQLAVQHAALQVGGKKIVSAGQVPINLLQITPQDRALAMQMNHQLTYMVQLAQKEASITGHYMSVTDVPGFAAWSKLTGGTAAGGVRIGPTGFFNLGRAHASGEGCGVCNASSCGDGSGGDGGSGSGCGGGGGD